MFCYVTIKETKMKSISVQSNLDLLECIALELQTKEGFLIQCFLIYPL